VVGVRFVFFFRFFYFVIDFFLYLVYYRF
jgi:hypothetical protein